MVSSDKTDSSAQSQTRSDLARENQSEKHEPPSMLGDFARAAAYSAIQSPTVAVAQIFDKATGSNVADNIHIIDAPKQADFGSVSWHLQQAGSAIGGLVPFMASLAVTKRAGAAFEAESAAMNISKLPVASTASLFRTGEMATAGFIQGAVFDPNQNKDGMFKERMIHGVTSGVSMGSMHMMSNKLSEFTGASLANASIMNKAFTTGLAGAGGSAVGLSVDSVLSGKDITAKDALQTIYQGAWTGTVLGGIGSDPLRLHEKKSNLSNLEEYFAREKNPEFSSSAFLDWQRKSWNPIQKKDGYLAYDLETFGPLERAEIVGRLARDADPLLIKPEVMQSFADSVEKTWSKHLQTADRVYNWEKDRNYTLQDAKDLQDGHIEPSLQDGRDYAGIKRMIKKSDRHLDALYDHRQSEIEYRREDLSNTINDFLKSHDLPQVDLEVVREMSDGAKAAYSDGRIKVTEKHLIDLLAQPELVNSLYHEITHLRQDVLYISNLADTMGLPKEPSAEQMDQLRQTVRANLEESRQKAVRKDPAPDPMLDRDPDIISLADKSARNANERDNDADARRTADAADDARLDRLVDDVITVRARTEMSAEDRAYAKNITENVENYFSHIHVRGETQLQRELSYTEDAMDFMHRDLAEQILTDTLAKPEEISKKFGFDTIPDKLITLAENYRKFGGNEDIESYESRLTSILADQYLRLQNAHDALEEEGAGKYYSNPLERQAHSTGVLAELTLKNMYPERNNLDTRK